MATASIVIPAMQNFVLPEIEADGLRRSENRAQYSNELLRDSDDRIATMSRDEFQHALGAHGLRVPTAAEIYHFVTAYPSFLDASDIWRTADLTATDFVRPEKQPSRFDEGELRYKGKGSKKGKMVPYRIKSDLWLVEENGQQVGEAWIPDEHITHVRMHPALGIPDGVLFGAEPVDFLLYNTLPIMQDGRDIPRVSLVYNSFMDKARKIFSLYLCPPDIAYQGWSVHPVKGIFPEIQRVA